MREEVSPNLFHSFSETRQPGFEAPPRVFLLNPKHYNYIAGKQSVLPITIYGFFKLLPLAIGIPILLAIVNLIDARGRTDRIEDFKVSIVAALLAVIFMIGFMVFIIIQSNREQQLAHNGTLITGEIVKIEAKNYDIKFPLRLWLIRYVWFNLFAIPAIKVGYRFTAPSGKEIFALARRATSDFDNLELPPENQPVIVLYQSDSHYKLL